jgi:uncharacterized membrane protein YbaN (DUF454 family)
MKRLVILGLGCGFIVLGILGLFLPVLQGILFLCIGLMLLAHEWPPAQRLLDRLRRRYPKAAATLDEVERRAKDWFARMAARLGNNRVRGRSDGPRTAPAGKTRPDRGEA